MGATASGHKVKIEYTLFLGWQIFLRDFKVRYRRAVLGFFWAVAPVIAISVMAVIIARQFNIADTAVPYPLVVVTGLVVWGVFADGLSLPQQMCRRSRTFLRRSPIPYGAILVACGCYMVLNLALKSMLVAGLMVYYAVAPGSPAGLTVPALAVLGLAGLTIGAFLAPISLVYLDIRYGLPFIQLLLLLSTPVFYPMPDMGLLHDINGANPLTYLILVARDSLLAGTSEHLATVLVIAPATILCFALSIFYYQRMMPRGVVHI